MLRLTKVVHGAARAIGACVISWRQKRRSGKVRLVLRSFGEQWDVSPLIVIPATLPFDLSMGAYESTASYAKRKEKRRT